VDHSWLVEKLKWYSIDGEVNIWIKSLLRDRSQQVVDDGVSLLLQCPCYMWSTPWLGLNPFLFNDITDGLKCTVQLFADDTMAYLTVRNKQHAEEFQRDLDKLVEWEKTWQTKFHPDKCEIISITRKVNPVKHPSHIQQYKRQQFEDFVPFNGKNHWKFGIRENYRIYSRISRKIYDKILT